MTDEENRVTRLETMQTRDAEDIKEIQRKVDAVHEDVKDIKQQLSRFRGFAAGAMFVLIPLWSAVVAMIISGWKWIATRFDFP